ncbi:MAG: 4-hydroxy-tetrahydrodipicolinate reductase [Vicingus serpentipes]|nr:4-hydroxy-tetrahydrodipicolinate reductase [Vicingus serpentipes]
MNIAIIGYGKMGKEIERIALERGHIISLKITSKNAADFNVENLKDTDVAIEFTNPDLAIPNINTCIAAKVPVVVGTTGWYDDYESIKEKVIAANSTLLAATNCSIGVNIFFKVNEVLAKMMNKQPSYAVELDEIHHTQKLDAPSGTGITLAEGVIENLDRKTKWVNQKSNIESELSIISHRINDVPGTHSVKYSSDIDDIEIKHTAHNRQGFALGAVVAAEYIHDKKGIFTMNDVLFN